MIPGKISLARLVATLVALLLVIGGMAWSPRSSGPTTAAATTGSHTVPWNGGRWFLLGVNHPWLNYGNAFGANAWGAYGVHADASYDQRFADMAAKGVHVVRWWLFADGRGGITTDASGTPTGLDSYVFPDLDQALKIAASRGVYLDLVLFDFTLLKQASSVNGVQLGGRSGWIADPAKRSALLDKVIKPTLARYAGHPRIMMWEVMNEPEWVISDLPEPAVDTSMIPVTRAQFWDFAARTTNAIHALTGAYATIRSASLKWHRVWMNAYADRAALPRLNLDVYQTHYYAWMAPYRWDNHPVLGTTWFSPLKQSYDALGLDRPMVVGELPLTSATMLDTLLANGYSGAWPWSYEGGEGFTVPWAQFTAWESSHAAQVRIAGGAQPPSCVALKIVGSRQSANSNPASFAYDGDGATSWRTTISQSPDQAWASFDLGAQQSVGSLWWKFARTGFADRVVIQSSTGQATWTPIAARGNAPTGVWQQLAVNRTARYVRFVFTNPHADPVLGFLSEVRICKST